MSTHLLTLALLASPAAAQGALHVGEPMHVLPRGPVTGDASLGCTYLDMDHGSKMHVRMTDAEGSVFLIFAQVGGSGTFKPGKATFLASGILDASGSGMAEASFPSLYDLPGSFAMELYGVYFGSTGIHVSPADQMVFNPLPLEVLDLDWSAEGSPMPAGVPVEEAWAGAAIHVEADNAVVGHPDVPILFDSSAPTGGDTDLVTPGYGWGNDVAYGKLLIIPENAGYASDPDDEAGGGTITFRFDQPTMLYEITLIDQDETETVQLTGLLGGEVVIDDVWAGMGDNSRMEIGFGTELVTELRVRLSGSGAVADLKAMPCPVRVGFDVATFGAPTGLEVGEVITEQLVPTLALHVSAQSKPGGTNLAALFDTANPTGGDTDLATPGYHPTNLVALGKVMILAENAIDADHDGLLDVPGDDAKGGRLTFDFDYSVVFEAATVIDVDLGEVSFFEAYGDRGQLLAIVPLAELGDNSVQTVVPAIPGVRSIVLVLGGSGALAEMRFCRELDLIDPQ